MITLYQFSTSPFTEKVRRALNYKSIPFDVHEVARAKVPQGDYAHVSPTGKFPAITHGDTNVWDSTDIIQYLDANFEGPSLIPPTAYDAAIAHAVEEWADESLYFYEMTMRLTWEHNLDAALDEFAATMPGVPKEALRPMIIEGVTKLVEAQGLGRKPRDQIVSDTERHLKALDGMLEGRDWLVGDALSVADLAVIGQLNALLYAKEAKEIFTTTKNIAPWMARVDEVAPK